MSQENPQLPKRAAEPLAPPSNKGKRLAMMLKVPRNSPDETPKEFAQRAIRVIADSAIVVDDETAEDDYLSQKEEEGYTPLRLKTE